MSALLSNLPQGRHTYFDQNGVPLAGGLVYFYQVNTTDPAVVYQDATRTTAAPVPVILDATGSLCVYGVGTFREYVTDTHGNVISDSVVVGSTPLTVTDAMLPVLEAATPADAESILTGGQTAVFTHIEVDADQTIHVAPTANAPDTLTSLTVQGDAVSPATREFLVNLGLNSQIGHGQVGADKVTLYCGLDAKSGTSDVWSLNTVLSCEANSGNYNAQGYELDFNNANADRGASGTIANDFAAPVAIGLSVSGAELGFTSTAGIQVDSLGETVPIWARGYVTAGRFKICGYQEWGTSPVGMQFDGAYSIAALNMTSLYGNAGAVTGTSLLSKNNQGISWQTANAQNVASILVDGNDNMFVGIASNNAVHGIFMGAPTVPEASGFSLGVDTNRWGDVWGTNLRMVNGGALTWDNNPSVAGAPGFVFDYVTSNNDRVVGSAAHSIYLGATTNPLVTNGYDLGTPSNTWGTIYSQGGVVTPSDLSLKSAVTPLADMLSAVAKVTPISFSWKDRAGMHYGFDAAQVQSSLAPLCEEHDGVKYLRKDDMLAVLWGAVRELSDQVAALQASGDSAAS